MIGNVDSGKSTLIGVLAGRRPRSSSLNGLEAQTRARERSHFSRHRREQGQRQQQDNSDNKDSDDNDNKDSDNDDNQQILEII
jgi:ABC-type cobalamin transport system ATPase subunit